MRALLCLFALLAPLSGCQQLITNRHTFVERIPSRRPSVDLLHALKTAHWARGGVAYTDVRGWVGEELARGGLPLAGKEQAETTMQIVPIELTREGGRSEVQLALIMIEREDASVAAAAVGVGRAASTELAIRRAADDAIEGLFDQLDVDPVPRQASPELGHDAVHEPAREALSTVPIAVRADPGTGSQELRALSIAALARLGATVVIDPKLARELGIRDAREEVLRLRVRNRDGDGNSWTAEVEVIDARSLEGVPYSATATAAPLREGRPAAHLAADARRLALGQVVDELLPLIESR